MQKHGAPLGCSIGQCVAVQNQTSRRPRCCTLSVQADLASASLGDVQKESKPLKMRNQLKHTLYKLLNRPGLRFILKALAATMATVRVGKLCKVSYEGEWVQRFPSCTLI